MAIRGVKHIRTVDAGNEWRTSAVAIFANTKAAAGWAFGTFGASVAAWTLLHPWAIVIPISAGASVAGSVCIWWYFAVQRTNSDERYHSFSHRLRDNACEILASNEPPTEEAVRRLVTAAAQDVADYYRKLFHDDSITTSIRLAVEDDDGVSVAYLTFGRSDKYDWDRPKKSMPIPQDKGLPARLRSADYQGVMIVPSIREAIKNGEYMETPNDSLPDCASLMVCAINAVEDGEKSMHGILSVAAKTEEYFRDWHTVPLRSFADTLGLVFPQLSAKLMPAVQSKNGTAVPSPAFSRPAKTKIRNKQDGRH